MQNTYTAYGLNISSTCTLPLPRASSEHIDINISISAVPENLSETIHYSFRYQLNENEFLMSVDNIARFLISDGNKIQIEVLKAANDRDVQHFLLESALPILLMQRGAMLFRATAVTRDGCAVLFVGPRGVGKSTIATYLQQRNWKTLSDSTCLVHLDSDPVVFPGLPWTNLWADSVEALDLDPEDYQRCRSSVSKRQLPLDAYSEPVQLDSIFVVTPGDGVERAELDSVIALVALRDHAHMPGLLMQMNQHISHFNKTGQLLESLSCHSLTIPRGSFSLEEVADSIESGI